MKNIVVLLLVLFSLSCKTETSKLSAKSQSSLLKTYTYKTGSKPVISVHRGGKGLKHYPENCLETLKYINDSIPAIYEIDVAKTKDNVLVLMHDNSLNRTTTGEGPIAAKTFLELNQFYLEDDYGNQTNFKIPLFKDVLIWAKKNQVILTIDIKKSVNVKDVVALIRETKAEDISIIITYDLKQALAANQAAPDLLLSVSCRNQEELDWLLHSKIPTQNMLAFTGTRLSTKAFYKKVHKNGIKCILGTLGNLDKQAEAKGDHLYKKWVDLGADIIATDRPFEVAKSLNIKND
ncbi:glycerophosphodiester phosphodiesterase family protein [Postechiella marina]|uniref:Glycerophosphodiester phosphodiesterase family protein n=1 Tax=Postechiella marina TaxID=943941 RepID=A0ABP8C0Z5_9FLAO